MRLDGKVVLIAGAGARIGQTVARLFAQEGARLVLSGRRPEPLEAMAAEVAALGGQAVVATGDLTTAEGAASVVERAVSALGRLDVLYNNLGLVKSAGDRVAETGEDDWDQLLDVNLRSAFLCTRAALPQLVSQGGGNIINVAASFGVRLGGNVGYAAAKAAVIALTEVTARQYLQDNIRANCIAPGRIARAGSSGRVQPPGPQVVRDGLFEDVAYAALYLASDESSWMTGSTLTVDGGADLRQRKG